MFSSHEMLSFSQSALQHSISSLMNWPEAWDRGLFSDFVDVPVIQSVSVGNQIPLSFSFSFFEENNQGCCFFRDKINGLLLCDICQFWVMALKACCEVIPVWRSRYLGSLSWMNCNINTEDWAHTCIHRCDSVNHRWSFTSLIWEGVYYLYKLKLWY